MSVAYNIKFYKKPSYYGGIISVDCCPRLVWDREKKVQVGSGVASVVSGEIY